MQKIIRKVFSTDHHSQNNRADLSHPENNDSHSVHNRTTTSPMVSKNASKEQELRFQVEQLEKQVEELRSQVSFLEEEIIKQKELKMAYKEHAVLLGNRLKACFQVAAERGIDPLLLAESPQQHTPIQEESSSEAVEDDFSKELMTQLASPQLWFKNDRLRSLQSRARDNGWYISESQIVLCNEVGRGATADTFKAFLKDGREVAVKCLRPQFFEDSLDAVEAFCDELELLSRLRHPNVIEFIGACLNPPARGWIVTEYASGGTLLQWLHGGKQRSRHRTVPLPSLSARLLIATQISQAMQYLHEQEPKVLHRDLKPSNVFLTDGRHAQVADFGFGKLLPSHDLAFSGEIGTYVYMAPEVINHEPYNEKCDIYSYGVLLCELITGDPPYVETSLTPPQIAFSVASGNLRPLLPTHDKYYKLVELICAAWDQDPKGRPSFVEITYRVQQFQNELANEF